MRVRAYEKTSFKPNLLDMLFLMVYTLVYENQAAGLQMPTLSAPVESAQTGVALALRPLQIALLE